MKEFDFEKVPIVEIANEILLDGVKRGASDIHFDPFRDGLVIRMRVDGVLYDYANVPNSYKRNMISRIKMIASMNIMETRLPQDGAIKSKIGSKALDLRVSSLPTYNGEKVVLRILDYSKSLQGLETLGFSKNSLDSILRILEIPNGIILVTGATGSGKSTTVYSILQKLNTREVNIITVEDPVEMEVEGLNQVQAQQEIGLDFATVLRSILRQDPDIIMIGEIRDDETARIAVRASITGHKVVSTIHTNNALNTIERLTDMDVERYLIGTSLNGIISQKLVRKICPHCRIPREPNDYEKKLFKKVLYKDVDKVYEANPEGCEHCFKGYKDRTAIAEVLVINDEIRSAITNFVPKDEMRKLVYINGHTHTLLEDGLEKIVEGETSFEEIYKVVDLENDLSVHESFNEEIKKDRNVSSTNDDNDIHPELVNEDEEENKITFGSDNETEDVQEEIEELKEEVEELKEEVEEKKPEDELSIDVPYNGLNIEDNKPNEEQTPEVETKEEEVPVESFEETPEVPMEIVDNTETPIETFEETNPEEVVENVETPIETFEDNTIDTNVPKVEETTPKEQNQEEILDLNQDFGQDNNQEEILDLNQDFNQDNNQEEVLDLNQDFGQNTEDENVVLSNPLTENNTPVETIDLNSAFQTDNNDNASIDNIYNYFQPEGNTNQSGVLDIESNDDNTLNQPLNNDDTIEIIDNTEEDKNKNDMNFDLNVPFVEETVDL